MVDHPGRFAPILTTDGPVPADPQHWACEIKWDGYRCLASIGMARDLRIFSRNGSDITHRYPELQELTTLVDDVPVVLDAEIVALDPATGAPSFGRLQQRSLDSPARIRSAQGRIPVTMMVFDVLVFAGTGVTEHPWTDRRTLLEGLGLSSMHIQTPPVWIGEVQTGVDWARVHGLEGVVLKRLNSRYLPGRRSREWVKVKFRPVMDVVLGGWEADAAGEPRSLMVGTPHGAGLQFRGSVGSGLSGVQRRLLLPYLQEAAADHSPFTVGLDRAPKGVRWLLPLLRAEAQYTEITSPGGRLRQPVWRGLRGVVGDI